MGTYIVTINTDNAAFDGADLTFEISRLLRAVADHPRVGCSDPIHLIDSNGNKVGEAVHVLLPQKGD